MAASEEARMGSAGTAKTTIRQPRPAIGLGHAIALYVGAVLGAGVLVLPGQVASLAGPASLLAWAFIGSLGLPLAMTFAALASRFPDAGGIVVFAGRAFGERAGGVAGWWYFTAVALGHVIVPLTGGYYVASALRIDQRFAYLFAGVILLLAVAANLAGLRVSGRVQLALAAGVSLLLLVTILVALPRVDPGDFTPFAPHGAVSIGRAAVVLFFAFAGWEAVAHLAGEFHDARRDLTRATAITVVTVLVLYSGVAFAVVVTGSYGSSTTDRVAVGSVLGAGFGISAATAAGVLAVVISAGTTNAFMAAISRLGYALARDQWFPRSMARLNTRGVPAVGVCATAGMGVAGLLTSYFARWGTEDLVSVPSTLILVTYLIGTAAGARLLSGRARVVAVVAFVLTAFVAPFAAAYVAVPVVVAVAALGYRRLASRRSIRHRSGRDRG
ncbi:amino acid efflux transporter [Saccharopolyspora lacisalsi]|uniref:Amino acid efflux transporter n=1 Tax=Halosaccharopolyspora lacisalsi TaxID=1000566 RepID=A0A839DSP4_9PSEU|nr:amino acid permease [Halosaccharopolyspora lacisalsi]MBA8825012.1 amino acid efflux transporter [Halosaccharopolyspora lacisalsi]